MKFAFITGINGQDGSYLAELLLKKNYVVHGLIRRCSQINTQRIDHILDKLILHYGDVTDISCVMSIFNNIKNKNPSVIEIYNLAAMSHVKVSFEIPEFTSQASGTSVLNILEAIRQTNIQDIAKFYQASTSELYGKVQEVPQNEKTPFYPRSPYGVAKLYGYWITVNYRESYNMFACNGILFNHESPRRGPTFVTRKITKTLGQILKGETKLTGKNKAIRLKQVNRYAGIMDVIQSNMPDTEMNIEDTIRQPEFADPLIAPLIKGV